MGPLGLCSAELEYGPALVESKKNDKGQAALSSFLLQPKSLCELGTLSFGMDRYNGLLYNDFAYWLFTFFKLKGKHLFC